MTAPTSTHQHIRPRKRQPQTQPQPPSTLTTSRTPTTTTTTSWTSTVTPGRSGGTPPATTGAAAASSPSSLNSNNVGAAPSTRTDGGILRQRPKYSGVPTAAAASPSATPLGEDHQHGGLPVLLVEPPQAIAGPIIERTRPRSSRSLRHHHNGSGTGSEQNVRRSNDMATTAVGSTAATTAVEGYIPRTAPDHVVPAATIPAPSSAATPPSVDTVGNNHNENANDNDEDPSSLPPLVFHSLTELLERAGTLPPQPSTATESAATILPGSLVEADLSFQVVDPETYDAQRQHSKGSDDDGHPCIDDEEEEADPLGWLASTGGGEDRVVTDDEEGYSDDDSNGEDDPIDTEEFWQSLRDHRTSDDYYSDDDDEDESDDEGSEAGDAHGDGAGRRGARDGSHPHSYQNRPFLVLWKALSQWVTPEAVRYLRYTGDETKEEGGGEEGDEHRAVAASPEAPDAATVSPTSDLEVARCAGLSAALHLHFAPALAGLQGCCGQDNPRWARIRVDGLLRRFDYALPAPGLDAAHLRALACVLLHAALRSQPGFEVDEREVDDAAAAGKSPPAVPEPCAALGLSPPEYRCLTRALLTFGLPHDSDNHLG